MIVPLSQLLQYQNSDVINRYKKEYPNNTLSPEEAFIELLKFLWLCNKHKYDQMANSNQEELNFQCVIHHEMKEIDDMWHTFLLFTKDYMDFCNFYFKKYIHHAPFSNEVAPSQEQLTTHLTYYLSYIYDHLGEKTLLKWFGIGD